MVCCLYKRVDYGTLKGHWFLKSNLKIKSTILHIKSITKRVLSVFIIFIKYFSFTNFEGLVVKYAPSFPPARARSSDFFICLLQERIKLYPLKFSYNPPWQDSVFFLSLQSMLWGLPFWLNLCKRALFSLEKKMGKGASILVFFLRGRGGCIYQKKVHGAETQKNK